MMLFFSNQRSFTACYNIQKIQSFSARLGQVKVFSDYLQAMIDDGTSITEYSFVASQCETRNQHQAKTQLETAPPLIEQIHINTYRILSGPFTFSRILFTDFDFEISRRGINESFLGCPWTSGSGASRLT